MRVATSSCDHPRIWRSRFRLCCQDEFFSMRHLLSSTLKRATQDTSLDRPCSVIVLCQPQVSSRCSSQSEVRRFLTAFWSLFRQRRPPQGSFFILYFHYVPHTYQLVQPWFEEEALYDINSKEHVVASLESVMNFTGNEPLTGQSDAA